MNRKRLFACSNVLTGAVHGYSVIRVRMWRLRRTAHEVKSYQHSIAGVNFAKQPAVPVLVIYQRLARYMIP
jgi:hypothetical protein